MHLKNTPAGTPFGVGPSIAAAVVALALLVSACSSSPESAPPPSPSGTTASTPGTPQPPSGPPTTTPGSTPGTPPGSSGKPGGPPTWTKLPRQPVDGQHVVTALPKYLVMRSSDEAGTTAITDRASKRVVVRHVPPAGFVAQSPVVIDDRWALVEEIRSDGPSQEIRAYRYALASGARTDLAKQKALPRISEPEIGAYDGVFAYSSTDSHGRSCLIVAELATLKSRSVACVADPGYIADPVVSADSVTFSQITAPSTPQRCKRLFTAALPGGPARPIAAAKNCIQWSGVSLRGATIWSEVGAADPDQYQSKAYVRTGADSPAQSLGQIVTDTIVACGNWIHWEVRTVTNGAEAFQIQRWQPGIGRPQRIYATPPDVALTAPSCQANTLIVEAAHLGGGSKYTESLQASTA